MEGQLASLRALLQHALADEHAANGGSKSPKSRTATLNRAKFKKTQDGDYDLIGDDDDNGEAGQQNGHPQKQASNVEVRKKEVDNHVDNQNLLKSRLKAESSAGELSKTFHQLRADVVGVKQNLKESDRQYQQMSQKIANAINVSNLI